MPCHFNHFLYEIWNNKICKDLIVFAINFERNSCSLVLWNCDWYECTFGDPLTQERTKYYCFSSFLSLWPRFVKKKDKKRRRRKEESRSYPDSFLLLFGLVVVCHLDLSKCSVSSSLQATVCSQHWDKEFFYQHN